MFLCRGGAMRAGGWSAPDGARYNRNVSMSRSTWAAGVAVACLAGAASWPVAVDAQDDEPPDLELRATPSLAFAPAEVVFTGRLRGGADDDERYYCVSAEWDWDDGTISESTFDCEPYEPGVSEIRRRFSRRHIFNEGGRYEIRLTLKRGDDIVATSRTAIAIQDE